MNDLWQKFKAYVKGAFRSKTMWLGGIVSALGALSDNAQYLRNIIKDDIGFNTLMIGIGIAISVLRIVTTKPLDEK
jgi:hypothetical protein